MTSYRRPFLSACRTPTQTIYQLLSNKTHPTFLGISNARKFSKIQPRFIPKCAGFHVHTGLFRLQGSRPST